MLDVNAPQSAYIFQASAVEERIRTELLLMRDAKSAAELLGREQEICLVLIPRLHQLNEQHFGDSPKIRRTVEALERAVSDPDRAEAWNCFLALAEHPGDNFGTWMI